MAKKADKPVMNPDEAPEELIPTEQVEAVVENKDEASTKSTAKAGKRSKKALEAAEAKEEKEERKKASATSGEAKPKASVKPARPKSERKGKNYKAAYQQIDHTKAYSLKDALALAQATSKVKFDASVELHINLAVDPKQADQNIRGNLVLPHGTGKTVRVAVFDDAKVENADISGVETITKQLEKGEINFDVLVASPANMAKLGKYARLLGPRGLMPNPKSGTVTTDVARAASEAKAGRVEYRVDSTGIVHTSIGKVSFKPEQLVANAEALMTSVRNARPSSVKGNYIKAIHVASTMGPSIAVDASA